MHLPSHMNISHTTESMTDTPPAITLLLIALHSYFSTCHTSVGLDTMPECRRAELLRFVALCAVAGLMLSSESADSCR